MRRTKVNRPASAILVADLHLTETVPICRTDDYLAAQARKLAFLAKLRKENQDCPILVAGDIFEKWKNSPWFIYWAYMHLPDGIITVPGNHELRFHSFKEYKQSTLHLLENIHVEGWDLTVLKNDEVYVINELEIFGCPFGEDVKIPWRGKKDWEDSPRILILHDLIWKSSQKPPWAAEAYSPDEILDKFSSYDIDLILTGHNHESFTAQKDETLLVNPGSMMRNTADQVDFRPRCFLYYVESNKVIPVYFPIEEGAVSQEHLDRKKQHEERAAAYIQRLNMKWKKSLSFRDNLETFFSANNTPRKVREILWQHLPDPQT